MLPNLLTDLNLTINETPVICQKCRESIKTFFDFKLNHSNFKLCLKPRVDAYKRNEEMVEIKQNICHWCIEADVKCRVSNINVNSIIEDSFTTEAVQQYLPELDIISSIMLCSSCTGSLQRVVHFIKTCLNTENVIEKYCSEKCSGSNGKANMFSVFQFISKVKDEEWGTDESETYIKQDCDSQMECKAEKVTSFKEKVKFTTALMQSRTDQLYESKGNTQKKDVPISKCEHHSSDQETLPINIHKCGMCSYETQYKGNLKVHGGVHLALFKCEMCTYQTLRRYDFERHVFVHKGKHCLMVYKCKVCTYETPNSYRFKQHLQIHANPSNLTMHKCKICSFQTRHKSCIYNHVLIHKGTSETVHQCKVCTDKMKSNISQNWQLLFQKAQENNENHQDAK